MKSVVRLASVLATTLIASPALAQAQNQGVTNDTIKIGTFGPITGANFALGKLVMNGLEAVFDDANSAGGIHGRKIQLVRVDDMCDPAGAIAAVRKLIFDEKVFAIVGGSCSNGVLAAKADIEQAGIPYLNFTAASGKISAPKVQNIFTSMLTSNLEGQLQAQYLIDSKVTKVAVVAQHDAWGRDRHETLLPALAAKGIKIVADEELSMDSNDATAQVLRVQSSGADAVVLLNFPKPASIFLRTASRLGFSSKFIGTTVIPDPVAFDQLVALPDATKNFVTISPSKHAIDSEEAKAWRTKLTEKFPSDTPHGYNLYGITAGQLAVAALKTAGNNPTRDSFISALESTKSLEATFAPASLNCNTHQCLQSGAWIKRNAAGKTETVGISELK